MGYRSDVFPERWQRVTAIFEAALDLPAEERPAFVLTKTEGDAELLGAVQRLLEADQSAESFLEQPAVETAGLVAHSATPTVIGRYQILERIGHGGFGDVFKARDPQLKRLVAVKTCRFLSGPLQGRFAREAEIAAGLDHPNITVVFDVGAGSAATLGAPPFLVQEFLSGEDLDHVIRQLLDGTRRELSLRSRIHILKQVAAGLAYAHARGVIHRDIKPGNLRLLEDGRVKIMDFGIAKLATAGSELTHSGAMIGTVAYMSPEQIRGEEVDARSDLFSWGVLAFELLTLSCPFEGGSPAAVMYQVLHEQAPRLREVWPRCPPKLESLVERCLVKNRGSRLGAAEVLMAELEVIGQELGPDEAAASYAAPTVVLPRRKRGWKSRRVAGWGLVAGLVAGLAVLGLVWTLVRPAPPIVPAGAAPTPAPGLLAVDALPWGEVIAVTTVDGTPASPGPQRFTPLVLTLPPGRYTVQLRHPRAGLPRSCEVEVVSGARVSCVVEFARVEVKAFLDQVGR